MLVPDIALELSPLTWAVFGVGATLVTIYLALEFPRVCTSSTEVLEVLRPGGGGGGGVDFPISFG